MPFKNTLQLSFFIETQEVHSCSFIQRLININTCSLDLQPLRFKDLVHEYWADFMCE